MKATVSHSAEEWYGLSYRDGKYNIIIEKFVDLSGKELAETVTTEGKAETAPKAISAYEYHGYIRTVVYQYTNGDAIPSIEKTANVETANVGDTLTYTVKLSNNKAASSAWKEVVLSDVIPDGLTFAGSSVYVDGKSAEHSFKDGVLSVPVGDIAASQTVTVTFKATVNNDMYNKTIYNTAVAEGKNGIVKDEDGNNGNATGQSPEIEIVSAVDEPMTDIHYQLFNGYGDGNWRPGDCISLQEACTVAYRLIANGGNTWLERGTVTVPDYEYTIPEEAKYFVSIGVLPASVFDTTQMTEDTDYEVNYEITDKAIFVFGRRRRSSIRW